MWMWSADQNSNCNWSLTSIIAFNYIYLFARRLLNVPLAPSISFTPYLSLFLLMLSILLLMMLMLMPMPVSDSKELTGFGW